MPQYLAHVALLVRDYDEAIAYFTERLGFRLVEHTRMSETKRWVLVAPPGADETALLLARAATPEQVAVVGKQGGGRVTFFLHTDDFSRDYERYKANGVEFVETPRKESYGTVVVFQDLCGNKWDLVQRNDAANEAR